MTARIETVNGMREVAARLRATADELDRVSHATGMAVGEMRDAFVLNAAYALCSCCGDTTPAFDGGGGVYCVACDADLEVPR